MTATFHVGDAIEVMSKLPEKSVDLILTSPPFLALRSYLPADHPDKALEGGSQATPGQYIDWLIDVVEACDRVLAPHGSLVLELGDTYAGSGGAGGDYAENGLREGQSAFEGSNKRQGNHRNDKVEMAERGIIGTTSGQRAKANPGKKLRRPCEHDLYDRHPMPDVGMGASSCPGGAFVVGEGSWPLAKSLSLIPELFRLTLVYGTNPLTGRTTDRWRLRNVVRWVRPNPPVGALGDKFRPATSELMVFCKSAKRYFDLDAVRTPHQSDPTKFTGNGYEKGRPEGLGVGTISEPGNPAGAPPLDWWNIPPGGYEGAHYAVWPKELLVKPIKAMCPSFVCLACGVALDSRHERPNTMPELRGADHVQPLEDAAIAQGSPNGAVLHEEMFDPVHGEAAAGLDSDEAGVHPSLGRRQVRDAASFGHGAIDRPGLDVGRSRSSLEQHQGRQPTGESGTTHQGRPRSDVETTASPVPVSTLPRVDTNHGQPIHTCPNCGSTEFRNGLILDCFGGSGTTALVATGHGRDCILIDLDERNYELALQRVGPFILSRAS